MRPYRCIACSADLNDAFVCTGCAKVYPALTAPGCAVPILVANPEGHLMRSSNEIGRALAEGRQRLDQLAPFAAPGRARAAVIARQRGAIAANLELGEALRQSLPVPPDPPGGLVRWIKGDPAKGLGYVRQFADYLRQDWAGTPEGEAAIALMRSTVAAQVEAAPSSPRRLGVVLGAGLGRFACEIAPLFDEVIALDQSVLMAASYAALHRGDLAFHEVNERNTKTRDDTSRAHVASLAHCRHRRDNVRYCVADGLDVPVSDGSVDVLLSVFFTDLVPLTALLAEASRLLAPGGRFIHFGPLGCTSTTSRSGGRSRKREG